MRNGAKAALVGGVFAVMVGGAGYGAYNLVSAITGGNTSAEEPGAVKTGPLTRDEIRDTTQKFFAAWEKGDAEGAAALTNNEDGAAQKALTGYREDAHITKVKVTPGTASGAKVPFSVKATVSYEGKTKPLSYETELTVVRGSTTGRPLVDWQPSVVHPDLEEGDTLVTGEASAPPIEAVDRGGAVLSEKKYPSLGPIIEQLRKRYGDEAGGTPGIELAVRHQSADVPDETLLTLDKGTPGKLQTTLSASVQAAAEKAVKKFAESSVVAVKPSTGEVLAVANHGFGEFNAAFEGKLAPASTMKIITAAMLIDNGVTSMNEPAPCDASAVWQSQTFRNIKGLEPNENATLADSFARSCNTAFVKLIDEEPLTDESLTREAQDRFGLGRDNWKTGIVSFDGSVPASPGPDRAANAIGQGQVQMSPLNMASVTATAITGAFRQPVIVPQELDDRELATARGLEQNTVAQLREMMRRTATSGTAAPAMREVAALGGAFGAKTGSAEVDSQATSNSWFTGYRGDIAAAAVTQEGGHGGDAAGPIVADVLRAGG
ncbi:penicillin-binding protein [Streptomyces sp. PSKA54]|uniref:Penicillin-binding protein n=1 Tax=Streptomyces himalayensis subsp. aureolus TaxID=2758039 RepID=A0A7W2D689_9ACTN|nr:penicillin-binding transpeptidase domain-containing protein [Streptomyces himalayensis]MBA4865327.1 penicillin-binding protein [Streptomyces himalayensis subsp. aureolus]